VQPAEPPAVVTPQAPIKPVEATATPKNEPPAPQQSKEAKPKPQGNSQPRKPQQNTQPKRQPQQQGKPRSPQGNTQKPQPPKPAAQPNKPIQPTQPEPVQTATKTEPEDAPIAIIKAESISAPEPEKKIPETKDIPRA
jgi:hypothetical protein